MKIEQRNAQDTQATEAARRSDSETSVRRPGADKAGSRGDRVEVSAEASLRAAALTAAQQTPDIRMDRVEAARQKLLNGEIGADAGKLADSMLDGMLK